MPFPSSRMVQNQIIPPAVRQPERTGTAQHHRPKATRTAFAISKPTARSLLMRLLTNLAGANTSYNLATYSSMECTAWARIRKRNTSWVLRFNRPHEPCYRKSQSVQPNNVGDFLGTIGRLP